VHLLVSELYPASILSLFPQQWSTLEPNSTSV